MKNCRIGIVFPHFDPLFTTWTRLYPCKCSRVNYFFLRTRTYAKNPTDFLFTVKIDTYTLYRRCFHRRGQKKRTIVRWVGVSGDACCQKRGSTASAWLCRTHETADLAASWTRARAARRPADGAASSQCERRDIPATTGPPRGGPTHICYAIRGGMCETRPRRSLTGSRPCAV